MATKEEISMIGFEIVAYAGDAMTDLLHALDAAREGDFDKAEELRKSAYDALIEAHNIQTGILSKECGICFINNMFIVLGVPQTKTGKKLFSGH